MILKFSSHKKSFHPNKNKNKKSFSSSKPKKNFSRIKQNPPKMSHKLDKLTHGKKVVVFSMTGCPHCEKVKNTLNSFQVEVTDVTLKGANAIDDAQEYHDAIKSKYNHETFPAVFINGKFVGGSDAVTELNQNNKLKQMLA